MQRAFISSLSVSDLIDELRHDAAALELMSYYAPLLRPDVQQALFDVDDL